MTDHREFVPPYPSVLLTDLYQLNMMQAYLEAGMTDTAVFEFFVRKLPEGRSFLLAAGLEQLLDVFEDLRASPAEIDWLRAGGRFSDEFVDYLAEVRFEGEVHAVPEGTVFFPDEPILRVIAPIPVAQLVETRVINILNFQTMIASKAARHVLAAGGRDLVDFGLRRAHGAEAGLFAARAAYIAGYAATATVQAGAAFDIPLSGTMAHSFVQAHDDEIGAYEDFAHARPDNVVLLIDTYDTEAAAETVVKIVPELARDGITVRGVRLDSGDLVDHARKVRKILDDGGCEDLAIFASGGIDEPELREFEKAGAPIDGVGIGTSLTTSEDAPAMDCAYKLQEYAGRARRKKSEGKATWPGRKQVYRYYDDRGRMDHDALTLDTDLQKGEALLLPMMKDGKRLMRQPSLDDIRRRAAIGLEKLPEHLRAGDLEPPYEVRVTDPLRELADDVDAFMERAAGRGGAERKDREKA